MFHRKQVILPSQSSSEASKPLFLRQKYLSFHLQLVFCISLFVLQNFLLLARVRRHRHALLKAQLHEAPCTCIAVCLSFSSLLVTSSSALCPLLSSSYLLYWCSHTDILAHLAHQWDVRMWLARPSQDHQSVKDWSSTCADCWWTVGGYVGIGWVKDCARERIVSDVT
jgi:hypothetical protein